MTQSFVVFVSNPLKVVIFALLENLELLVKPKYFGSCLFVSNFFCCEMSIICWLSRHTCHLTSAVLSFASTLKSFLCQLGLPFHQPFHPPFPHRSPHLMEPLRPPSRVPDQALQPLQKVTMIHSMYKSEENFLF